MCKRESEVYMMSMQVKKVKLEESKKRERRAASFKFVLTKENKKYMLETIAE
jgi:N-glycosylase/DNA lyase